MAAEYFIDRHRGGERALLVQMDLSTGTHEEDLAEFQSLAEAAAVKTLAIITGKLSRPNPKSFIGSGKGRCHCPTSGAHANPSRID